MSISGLMSAFFAPGSVGFALAQHAQRLRADDTAISAARPATPTGGGCECGGAGCEKCTKSRFDTSDPVELSDAALAASQQPDDRAPTVPAAANKQVRAATLAADESTSVDGQELTEAEQTQVREIRQRDAEVRRHEAAHQAAAGEHSTGGPTFDYQRGPDGRNYAIGGEVQIDTSPVEGDPEATIRKMQQVRAAALAPAEPSGQDRSVAAQAAAAAQQAQVDLAEQHGESDEGEESDEPGSAKGADERPRRGANPYERAQQRDRQPDLVDLLV